jgi:protein-tyrosine phosphatase
MPTPASAGDRRARSRPWRLAIVWLVFLAPFFYLTYGAANASAATREHVPSVVFGWERHVPFLPWTIVPYWSINGFYALSLFICATRHELTTHVKRLVTVQVAAVACFLVFPLQFTFERPVTNGLPGALFAALTSFDRPFNQAPSLHIALLIILWPLYRRHLPKAARVPLHLWFALVGVSVLTTFQHHFFDVPTGVLLGAATLWALPDAGRSPVTDLPATIHQRGTALSIRYLTGSLVCGAFALALRGAALWLVWPAVSLMLVALNYAAVGPGGFQKNSTGRMSLASCLLFAPYLAAAFVNSRLWTRRRAAAVAIDREVWLGRLPTALDTARFATVVDVCAELPRLTGTGGWISEPMLDLVPPSPEQLRRAAAAIERAHQAGPVLVCCALGYSRSAAAVATWLVTSSAAQSVDDAIERVRRAQPRCVIPPILRTSVAAAVVCAT